MTLSLQNSVRTTTKGTEIHSKIKLNERPQAPCQAMASHLCQAGHCEEPQESKAAIIAAPPIWAVGLGSNRQNPGRREDVEHFYRGCQGRRASLLVSLKSVKTNPGRVPRRARCKFKQIKKARCHFHLSSSLFWGTMGRIVTVFSGGPRQCRGFMEVMVLFSGVNSPCQAARESYFPPVALLPTVYRYSVFIV